MTYESRKSKEPSDQGISQEATLPSGMKGREHKDSLSPCCKEFRKRAIAYIDLSVSEDDALRTFASLLWKMEREEVLEARDASSIAFMMEQYLKKKLILEHVFLGRTLQTYDIDKTTLKHETARIRALLTNK